MNHFQRSQCIQQFVQSSAVKLNFHIEICIYCFTSTASYLFPHLPLPLLSSCSLCTLISVCAIATPPSLEGVISAGTALLFTRGSQTAVQISKYRFRDQCNRYDWPYSRKPRRVWCSCDINPERNIMAVVLPAPDAIDTSRTRY